MRTSGAGGSEHRPSVPLMVLPVTGHARTAVCRGAVARAAGFRRTLGQWLRAPACRAAEHCWLSQVVGTNSRGRNHPAWPVLRRPSPRTGQGQTRTCRETENVTGVALPHGPQKHWEGSGGKAGPSLASRWWWSERSTFFSHPSRWSARCGPGQCEGLR